MNERILTEDMQERMLVSDKENPIEEVITETVEASENARKNGVSSNAIIAVLIIVLVIAIGYIIYSKIIDDE